MKITIAMVDAVLETVDADPSAALADMLDKHGEWDWSDDGEHDPSERVAVVESSGAFWAVYRGSESDEAVRCATEDAARAKADAWIDSIEA